jgi:hypothetical protein
MMDSDALTGDLMIDLMLDPDRGCNLTDPLALAVLNDDEVALLLRLLTRVGRYREDLVITTEATLRAAGITEETAREALARQPFYGDPDYTQHVDLALDPEHLFFVFVDDQMNPKWRRGN